MLNSYIKHMKLVTRIIILFQNILKVKELSRTPKCYFTWKHLELHCGSLQMTKVVVNKADNVTSLKCRSVYLNYACFKLVVRHRSNFSFPEFG